MNIKRIGLSLLLLACLAGCEKLFIKPDPDNNAIENFESMWQRIDEKYSFFDYKNLNWDSVHAVFRPKVYAGMSNDSLFKVLNDMLFTLRDGHVNLISGFNISRNWEWYLGYPQNFNRGLLERNYWGNDYEITGAFIHRQFTVGSKKIAYIYYGSFESTVSTGAMDYIMDKYADTDGLIIDVRDNGGGLVSNVFTLTSYFMDDTRLVGYDYEKAGKGHRDFGPAIPTYISSRPRYTYLGKPIVLLTNRSCYSSCTLFAGYMSTLPNVSILGDRTGGGGGLPTSYQLPNGWYYRFSTTYTTLPDGFNIEHGVPEDLHVDMNPTNEAAGIDDILEAAFLQF